MNIKAYIEYNEQNHLKSKDYFFSDVHKIQAK